MDFILGCNYWASNAGTEMWREFDIKTIEKDLRILSSHGVTYMRVFPNWRDFQPIIPLYVAGGTLVGYCKQGGNTPEYGDYIDETMMERFTEFLNVCEKYNIKLIVGLITGWMSGGLFIPPALYNKDVLTDHTALYFQQLFIKAFVSRFKGNKNIYAWDLGNECNCMGDAKTRMEAANWTSIIANAIKAADPSRPVVSGMHGLGTDNNWTIMDQSKHTDILTTHPYPYWCQHTRIDETLSYRTTMHATAQNKYYSEIGNVPCLAEEIGTMGPMICSDDLAADFLRINMFSLWANGSVGVMWWCANEQTNLNTYPYTHAMVEQELGMLKCNFEPKPVLKEMKYFADLMESLNISLPKAKTDGVVVLTRGQDTWGTAYMSHILAKKSGLNFNFAYGDNELPDSPLYLLPSVNGVDVMPKDKYNALKKKVLDGADLYISIDNGVLSEFEDLTGVKIIDSFENNETVTAVINGKEVSYSRLRNIRCEATSAKVLVNDNSGNPFITVNNYGKGKVYFVNAPVEASLISKHNAFEYNPHFVYNLVFEEYINQSPVSLDNDLVYTYHQTEDGAYIVILNHSNEEKEFTLTLKSEYRIQRVCYGEENFINPYDACIIKIIKE